MAARFPDDWQEELGGQPGALCFILRGIHAGRMVNVLGTPAEIDAGQTAGDWQRASNFAQHQFGTPDAEAPNTSITDPVIITGITPATVEPGAPVEVTISGLYIPATATLDTDIDFTLGTVTNTSITATLDLTLIAGGTVTIGVLAAAGDPEPVATVQLVIAEEAP